MKRFRMLLPGLFAILALTLTACGGGGGGGTDGGGGGGGGTVNTDLDSDGIPNIEDAFPEDGARFALFTRVALEGLSTFFSAAVDISDTDLVVGFSDNGSGIIKAVKWTVSGTSASAPVQLNPLAENAYSAAYGINDAGAAVGESENGDDIVPVLWAAGSSEASTLSLTGYSPPASAYGINNIGQIIGEAIDGLGATRAVLWSSSSSDPITLGGLGGTVSAAYFINDAGMIVGESVDVDGALRGVVWMLDGGGVPGVPVALAPLPGHVSSLALSINAAGEVVGESESDTGEVHAVLWTLASDGTPGDPVDLGVGSAGAVNEFNRIAGYGGAATQAKIWDNRNTSLSNDVVTGAAFSQGYGINNGDRVVGMADAQAFVAVPQ